MISLGKESLSQKLRGEEVLVKEWRNGGGGVGIASRQRNSTCKGPEAGGNIGHARETKAV